MDSIARSILARPSSTRKDSDEGVQATIINRLVRVRTIRCSSQILKNSATKIEKLTHHRTTCGAVVSTVGCFGFASLMSIFTPAMTSTTPSRRLKPEAAKWRVPS
jgi:hypothetical protein